MARFELPAGIYVGNDAVDYSLTIMLCMRLQSYVLTSACTGSTFALLSI